MLVSRALASIVRLELVSRRLEALELLLLLLLVVLRSIHAGQEGTHCAALFRLVVMLAKLGLVACRFDVTAEVWSIVDLADVSCR